MLTPIAPRQSAGRGPRFDLNRWLRWATWALVAATLVGRLGEYYFVFELVSHFVVLYCVVAVFLSAYWLFTGSRLVRITTGCLLLNSFLAAPWLVADPPAAAQHDFRVLHANVLYTDTDMQRTIRLIGEQQPDLFVLQEMTPATIRALVPLRSTYPFQYEIWSKGPCHILVGSRTPFSVDKQAVKTQQVIHLTTTINGREMALVTVHPRTPVLPSWFAERNRQLAYVADLTRREPRPTLLIGDFNISVFSPVYHRIFEEEPVSQPALAACRKGFGISPTWPRFFPPGMIPIDHAFVNGGLRTVRFQPLEQPGSDHKAVVVDLKWADRS
ncbi:endonuclease/exonuclease/phosphatase [Fibrisoma limi BUZ 3]|uniref:Endonuclease/exonuclease/phosphatase n=1 Tax=Fibrisoma limi BUZ 3 TaxID=1185876 RepID=I2GH81_9BACT|nr:endonuclease/exonuclease/phosphatase [Fibrisoma limi BUZ 3]